MLHSKEYGCITRTAKQNAKSGKKSKHKIHSQFCLTHKIYTCRCGKEWGKH